MRTLVACLLAVGAIAAAGCGLEPRGALIDETSSVVREDGFPCEVRAVLETYCAPCHAGNTYVVAFHSRDIWFSLRHDGLTIGQYAAMQVAAGWMPPTAVALRPDEGERAILLDWVAAGMPAGACAPLTPPPRP